MCAPRDHLRKVLIIINNKYLYSRKFLSRETVLSTYMDMHILRPPHTGVYTQLNLLPT